MARRTTFSRKVVAGFATTVVLTLGIGAFAVNALHDVVVAKDRVIDAATQPLLDAERLQVAAEQKVGAARTYLLTGAGRYLDQAGTARAEFATILQRLRRTAGDADERHALDVVAQAEEQHQQAVEKVIAVRRSGAGPDQVVRAFDALSAPKRDAMNADIAAFVGLEERNLAAGTRTASADADRAITVVILAAALAAGFAIAVAVVLTRVLRRQIGAAVGQVQSSSTELEAAAGQQAAGAKEQATAMGEITTTINDLLATSRQIAGSAQRVAGLAAQTAGAARRGDDTVEQANVSIAAIRNQADLVLGHMRELGQKSQQIGAVLDIVSELADQTNILAVNATIEASGAGESSRRFAVVADEIRKLADRVGGSTKEVRSLIDDVRGAVRTTMIATETGAKAIDDGSRQYEEVAASFKQIADLVATTTEAAQAIELSTMRQATAVEQVDLAAGDVAAATRAGEASSVQSRQTASQLAALSTDLLRLVDAGGG